MEASLLALLACMALCHVIMNPFSIRCKGLKCTPLKAISGIRCLEVADYSSTGPEEIFLLWCDSQEETVNKTNCDDFDEVECSKA